MPGKREQISCPNRLKSQKNGKKGLDKRAELSYNPVKSF